MQSDLSLQYQLILVFWLHRFRGICVIFLVDHWRIGSITSLDRNQFQIHWQDLCNHKDKSPISKSGRFHKKCSLPVFKKHLWLTDNFESSFGGSFYPFSIDICLISEQAWVVQRFLQLEIASRYLVSLILSCSDDFRVSRWNVWLYSWRVVTFSKPILNVRVVYNACYLYVIRSDIVYMRQPFYVTRPIKKQEDWCRVVKATYFDTGRSVRRSYLLPNLP